MNVAELGIAIDSGQVRKATTDLNEFAGASKRTESQIRAIEAAAKRQGVSYAEMEARYRATSSATDKMNARFEQAAKLALKLSDAQRANDAIMGRHAQTIAEFDRAQVKADASSNQWINTLTRRFVLGFIITQLRAMVQAVADLNREMAKTGDVGRLSGIGGQNLQGLQTAGARIGIDPGKMADDMVNFSREVDRAKQGVGDLASLFALNGQRVGGVEDALLRVADLVKNAKNDTQKFQIAMEAGLPGTLQWVKLLEQGSPAIIKARDEASKLTNEQLGQANELDQKWNSLWHNFGEYGKRAILGIADFSKLMFGTDGNNPFAPRSPVAVTVHPASGATPAANLTKTKEEIEKLIRAESLRIKFLAPLPQTAEEFEALLQSQPTKESKPDTRSVQTEKQNDRDNYSIAA